MPAAVLSNWIWDNKYRLQRNDRAETDLDATWRRVARAVARVEAAPARQLWTPRFLEQLRSGRLLPGGRIIAGAGSGQRRTLCNCFVMGTLEDSLSGIMRGLRESAVTLQQGGGIGIDFSPLRPAGSIARGSGGIASGPVSFMEIWDSTCSTLLSTSPRRGAMMATLRCDHPDIERFVDAKRARGRLSGFNLSVLISDAFMQALQADGPWLLSHPSDYRGHHPHSGSARRQIGARDLWQRLLRAAYDSAEPGVLFIDRINACNNLRWREQISATNPCGEVPLPANGSCNLAALNLPAFIASPFCTDAQVDLRSLAESAAIAVRFLDDVIDVTRFPLRAQASEARATRRIGLGITGLADALVMLGLRYDSETARRQAGAIMRTITHAAYQASIALAEERGSFPCFEQQPYLHSEFIGTLPAELRDNIARHGIRNSHLTAIAPTGSISLLAGNVSSGMEPIFSDRYERRLRDARGRLTTMEIEDWSLGLWRARGHSGLPPAFSPLQQISADDQLAMQAVLQPFVDNAISKTVSVAASTGFESFAAIYERAWALGLKGCTAYRPDTIRGAVIGCSQASPCERE
ncbi:MAG: adenosylcobalamin-dependent ribonucleoside-diphosphate reductase [Gammaproteobacteria bacterium]|nr:adenosylcobalamin-dependent ribonucleoside-diphosphate reductase [Gammaproteobacteria bacterium]